MKPRPQCLRQIKKHGSLNSIQCIRLVHTNNVKNVTAAAAPVAEVIPRARPAIRQEPALACLPLKNVLRTYCITAISSSPTLLSAAIGVLKRVAASKGGLSSLDKNPALRWLLKKTFYAQFCAGENKEEVSWTVEEMRKIGYKGVILEYALEVLGTEGGFVPEANSAQTRQEIETWRKGMLETLEPASPGDFIALKWTGLGAHALHLLEQNKPPTPAMLAVIDEVCTRADQKGVSCLPGAEEEAQNPGIDNWDLDLMARYNKPSLRQLRLSPNSGPKRAVMYNTYQAYLKSTPARLSKHLAAAKKGEFMLGVKLVRGAYLASEPPHLMLGSKEETDKAYDELAAALLKREYSGPGGILQPVHGAGGESFPEVSVVLATHNLSSVRKAQKLRMEQAEKGEQGPELAYGQLQGMADEVSCELVQAAKAGAEKAEEGMYALEPVGVPKPYKSACWGTMNECVGFLTRRAAENKDAASRTLETRKAMGREIARRLRATFGLA